MKTLIQVPVDCDGEYCGKCMKRAVEVFRSKDNFINQYILCSEFFDEEGQMVILGYNTNNPKRCKACLDATIKEEE